MNTTLESERRCTRCRVDITNSDVYSRNSDLLCVHCYEANVPPWKRTPIDRLPSQVADALSVGAIEPRETESADTTWLGEPGTVKYVFCRSAGLAVGFTAAQVVRLLASDGGGGNGFLTVLAAPIVAFGMGIPIFGAYSLYRRLRPERDDVTKFTQLKLRR